MKKLVILFITLVSLASVFSGCTSTQLEEYFEIETVEEVQNERQ